MKEIVSTTWGGRTFSLETGHLAKQANGSVVARYGESVVLVTAVASREPRQGIDFFPLSVDYIEMTYAAGKIPGGFFKREGRPSEREVLTSRFIDRPLRPLFPKGFKNEVQIIATVLSADGENDPDVVAMSAASAALQISDIPFNGPIAGVRVGHINGEFVINPDIAIIKESLIDVIVAGSRDAVVMVEGGAKVVSESMLIEAIEFAHNGIKQVLDIQDELKAKAGKPKMEVAEESIDPEMESRVRAAAEDSMALALQKTIKQERSGAVADVFSSVTKQFEEEFPDHLSQVRGIVAQIEKKIIREKILKDNNRLDGRTHSDIRQISSEVGMLPRTHGSALFTRGETQALASTTLGTAQDEQRIDSLTEERTKAFMLHYNFPPYCVGEVKFLRSPGRREIGHGALAERSIAPVLPTADTFPYTIRIVSEVLESNGSSSMATVCGSVLSLMDAGVPIKQPVAGIAMGLVKEGEDYRILSDILGDEDHVGDMDFKVAGTVDGVTAIQMDIKITGITHEIFSKALEQARDGRLHILDMMNQTISAPRPDVSPRAPRIVNIQIRPDKVSTIIGPGGKTIRNIIAQTGVKIDVEDSGKIIVASPDKDSIDKAVSMIGLLVEEAEVDKIYLGKVKTITDFGAFVEILPGIDGLVHISQLENERVKSVRDVLSEGDEVLVKVLEIDSNGKIRLSRKAVLSEDINNYKKQ